MNTQGTGGAGGGEWTEGDGRGSGCELGESKRSKLDGNVRCLGGKQFKHKTRETNITNMKQGP